MSRRVVIAGCGWPSSKDRALLLTHLRRPTDGGIDWSDERAAAPDAVDPWCPSVLLDGRCLYCGGWLKLHGQVLIGCFGGSTTGRLGSEQGGALVAVSPFPSFVKREEPPRERWLLKKRTTAGVWLRPSSYSRCNSRICTQPTIFLIGMRLTKIAQVNTYRSVQAASKGYLHRPGR